MLGVLWENFEHLEPRHLRSFLRLCLGNLIRNCPPQAPILKSTLYYKLLTSYDMHASSSSYDMHVSAPILKSTLYYKLLTSYDMHVSSSSYDMHVSAPILKSTLHYKLLFLSTYRDLLYFTFHLERTPSL